TGDLVATLADPSLSSIQYNGKPIYDAGSSHRDYLHSLAFSPDGLTLASGGYREVKLWRRPAPRERLNMASGAVTALAISVDDKWLATAAADNSIKLWNLADGKPGKTLSGHDAAVTGLQFSPDGKQIYSCSQDKSVRLWSIDAGATQSKLEAPAAVNALVVTPENKIVAACADKTIYVWDALDGQPRKIEGHTGPVTSLAVIGPSGAQVLSGSEDGTVRVWDVAKGTQVRSMAHGGPVTSVAAKPDGTRFASAGSNNLTKLWQGDDGKQVIEIKGDIRAQNLVAKLTADETDAKAAVTAGNAAVTAAEKNSTEKADAAKKAVEAKAAAEKTATEMAEKAKTAAEAAEKAQKAFDEKKDDKNLEKAAADAQKASTDAAAAAKKAEEDKTKATDAIPLTEKSSKEATDNVTKAKSVVETL